jgi:hypothetical protein
MQNEQHQPPHLPITSRERVQKALRHEETDRLPIDLGGMASTGIMAIAYARLKEHLGIMSGEIRVFDMGQQLAEVEPEVLSRFGVDVISLGNSLGVAPELWKPWTLPNGVGCKIPAGVDLRPDQENDGWLIWENGMPMQRMSPGSLYFSEAIHPLAELTTQEELQYVPRPVISDEELKFLEMRAKALYENTDFAIIANFGGSILETGNSLRGFSRFFCSDACVFEYPALMDLTSRSICFHSKGEFYAGVLRRFLEGRETALPEPHLGPPRPLPQALDLADRQRQLGRSRVRPPRRGLRYAARS